MTSSNLRPTDETYQGFQAAYDHFNTELFAGRLPACMITLRTFGKARGYFSPDRFVHLADVTTTHEIALDPRQFMDRTAIEVLSTLVHEMCHLEQAEHGKPSRNGYHNRQWAQYMDAVGLVASNTGQPGGKRTGQAMTHYIAPEGPFELAAGRLLDSGRFVLGWADTAGFHTGNGKTTTGRGAEPAGKKTAGTRHKYVCPECRAAVWGRPGLAIACVDAGHDPQSMT
jgi:predicted SprT family Zn-dependent metalloprotease